MVRGTLGSHHDRESETVKPEPPLYAHPPVRIAADTWLVQHFHDEGLAPTALPVHSAVVLGAEPVLVDTGAAANRAQWLDDVFGLVDPCDLRWVFLSHDHLDHVGNLDAVLDLCPRATLVASRQAIRRLGLHLAVPAERCLLVEDGEAFDAGDRRFRAVRPPVYDTAATCGLLDDRTGVYWAADAWGTTVADAVSDAADLDPARWTAGLARFARATAPWLDDLPPDTWAGAVQRVASLRPAVIASAHGPVASGARVGAALDALRDLAGPRLRDPVA